MVIKMKWKFKQLHSFDERKFESTQILNKYPDKVPLILQKAPGSAIGDLDKYKFLIPYEVTIAQFIWVLRQRLKLDKNKAIYLFVGKTLPQSSALIGEIYKEYKDADNQEIKIWREYIWLSFRIKRTFKSAT